MLTWIALFFLLSPEPVAVYEGSTQCPIDIREFHHVTTGRACDKITWRLELYGNGEYVLTSTWGYYIDNANWELRGTNEQMRGSWQLRQGAPGYTKASIYVLTSRDRGGRSLSFMKVDDNILQLMTPDNVMSAGGSDFSNTLSRVEPVIDSTFDFVLSPNTDEAGRPNDKIVLEGRTPSAQIAKELGIPLPTNDPYNTPWPKVKWRLSLRFDDGGQPSTFEIRRITDQLSPVNGRWKILKGWKDNPDAVVLKLDIDDSRKTSIYLLKGSRDVYFFLSKEGPLMVGNAEYAYSLNRSYDPRLLKD